MGHGPNLLTDSDGTDCRWVAEGDDEKIKKKVRHDDEVDLIDVPISSPTTLMCSMHFSLASDQEGSDRGSTEFTSR